MADTYVSALWGDDTNDGLSVANAKLTIQAGADAAGVDDTINVFAGTYNEAITITSSRKFFAKEKVILDGQNELVYGIFQDQNAKLGVENFEIRNYTIGGIRSDSAQVDFDIKNNIIYNCAEGIEFTNSPGDQFINFNTIYNCGIGILLFKTSGSAKIENNTLYKCGNAVLITSNNADLYIIKNNIFSKNEVAIRTSVGVLAFDELDGNIYDVDSGDLFGKVTSTQYSTFADWKTATGKDINSQEGDPQLSNPDNGLHSVLPGSISETGAVSGTYMPSGQYVGARKTEYGWYTEELITSGVTLTDAKILEFQSFSGISPDTTVSVVDAELGVLNMGASRNVKNILDSFLEEFPAVIVDSVTDDNTQVSGEITIEFRAGPSVAAIAGIPYIRYNLRTPVTSGTFEDQFVQAKFRLHPFDEDIPEDGGANDLNAVLMLYMDGFKDARNEFYDSSQFNHVVSTSGSAQVDFVISHLGSGSAEFDGAGDFISVADSDEFALGTGNYTIDFWMRPQDPSISAVRHMYIMSQDQGDGLNFTQLYIHQNFQGTITDILLGSFDGGSGTTISLDASSIDYGEGHHIAIVQDDTNISLYIDGVLAETFVSNIPLDNQAAPMNIGKSLTAGDGQGIDFLGHIDEFRISKVARWTKNFTPPTVQYPDEAENGGQNDSQTVLMLHMEGSDEGTIFTDDSGEGHTVTASGFINTESDQFKFGSTSAEISGAGSYLSIPDSDSFYFNEDFTIDFWARFNSFGDAQRFFNQRDLLGSPSNFDISEDPTTPNKVSVGANASGINLLTGVGNQDLNHFTLSANIWYHFAFVKSGFNFSLFIDGVLQDTIVFNGAMNNIVAPITIGNVQDGLTTNFDGYIDEYRITNGIARWTQNFTPPSGAYRDQ